MDLFILQFSTHNKLCPFIDNSWSSLKNLATWQYIMGGSVQILIVSLWQVENDAIVALTLKDDGNYVASNTYSQVAGTVLNHLPVTIDFFLVLNCNLALTSWFEVWPSLEELFMNLVGLCRHRWLGGYPNRQTETSPQLSCRLGVKAQRELLPSWYNFGSRVLMNNSSLVDEDHLSGTITVAMWKSHGWSVPSCENAIM